MKTTRNDVLRKQAMVKEYWNFACLYDSIDPNTNFVIFSKDNPYQPEYNVRMIAYLNAAKRYQEGQ